MFSHHATCFPIHATTQSPGQEKLVFYCIILFLMLSKHFILFVVVIAAVVYAHLFILTFQRMFILTLPGVATP